MKQPISLTSFCCYVLIIFCLFISCNDSSKVPGTTAQALTDNTAKDSNSVAAGANGITPGTLDNLYMTRAEFLSIPNGRKLVLQYIFESANFLTLHGWIAKQSGVDFDPPPNFKLKKGHSSVLPYGVNTYFGNEVVQSQDVNSIKAMIEANATFTVVLFKPAMDGQHIVYNIYLSNDSNDTLVNLTSTDTGKMANPSPPRTS